MCISLVYAYFFLSVSYFLCLSNRSSIIFDRCRHSTNPKFSIVYLRLDVIAQDQIDSNEIVRCNELIIDWKAWRLSVTGATSGVGLCE